MDSEVLLRHWQWTGFGACAAAQGILSPLPLPLQCYQLHCSCSCY